MHLKILVTAGDGIGPEVTNEAVAVLKEVARASAATPSSSTPSASAASPSCNDGTPLPADTLAAALDSDAVLLGAVGGNEFNSMPPDKRPEAGLLGLRAALGGFANLRPCFSFKELTVNSPLAPRDRRRHRHHVRPRTARRRSTSASPASATWTRASAATPCIYTRDEVARVARIAFQLAQKRRKKLTSVDKANVLEVSQLWRAAVIEVAKEFPDVTLEHQYVDAMAMHMMNRPRDFDVVLTENLFGDILTDESGVITGSLGMLPSATIGGKVNLYEPVHGSAPDIAGKGLANPLGAILTAALSCATPAASKQKPPRSKRRSARCLSLASARPI